LQIQEVSSEKQKMRSSICICR